MKRWTSTWAALVVAGFLVVPGTGFAQTPAAPTASATTTQDKAEQGTPQEHLQRVDAALNSISPTAASGKAKAQIAELKKRVHELPRASSSTASSSGIGGVSHRCSILGHVARRVGGEPGLAGAAIGAQGP